MQEDFRRQGAHAANRSEGTEKAELVSEPEPCDNAGVVAEIRMKGAAANEARPVSIELGAAEVAALKRVLESFEDGHIRARSGSRNRSPEACGADHVRDPQGAKPGVPCIDVQ